MYSRIVPAKGRIGALVCIAMLGALLLAPAPTRSQSIEMEPLPPGARIETVLEDMNGPVTMAFDPAGRLFYTERTGALRLFADGRLQPEPVITFEVANEGEQGLLGVAIDPGFAENRYIYVYYTCEAGTEECSRWQNRVVRMVERDGRASELTTIFTSDQESTIHVGGNIHFGPDGKLYVSVGDNGQWETAQAVDTKTGKLHRINSDGTSPVDNPHFEHPDPIDSIYAIGLRNSFDFTFDPLVPNRIFASENGPACDDELNRIEAGGNYGWRADYPCDDSDPDPRYNTFAPLWHTVGEECCLAPTGVEVYTGSQIPQWRNDLFMATYNGGTLFHFRLNEDRTLVAETHTVEGVTATMDVVTGPDGALYYIEDGGIGRGKLRRIVGTGEAQPTATSTPQPTPSEVPGEGSLLFPETGKSVRGLFLDYWQKNGGLAQQGYPISEVMDEVSELNGLPYKVQYFERAVFEYHPENQAPYNVLLSQLGTVRYRSKYPEGASGQQPSTAANKRLFPETGKYVGGRFLQYWEANGGLAQQGLPISDEFPEVSDLNGKPYLVQYFERAVFELHLENAAPYDVLLSHLGVFQFMRKYPGGELGGM